VQVPLFGHHIAQNGANITVPLAYGAHTRWIPRLGDIFPNFTATGNTGVMRFHEWAEGSWTYFFSHPAAFTPVCTTEIADVASHAEELRRRGVKALNISVDGLDEQAAWIDDIERMFDVKVDFPLLSDPDGEIAKACDMVHPHEDGFLCVRKGFIIDPSLKIRMIFEYPMNVGRDFEEVLRIIDALQATEGTDLVAPGGWMPGDPLLLRPDADLADAKQKYGARLNALNSYIRLVGPTRLSSLKDRQRG
jgi:peroxiredoxin (alkyl hydroperoxide reductase subunit C)